jgi:hypothetical protein
MLGIQDTSKDTILTQLISDADYTINSLLWIDWFDSSTATEKINKNRIKLWAYWYKIYLNNFNVATITKINWTTYTGVLNTDYKISNSRVVEIKDFYLYDTNNQFEAFEITYTYWYSRTPTDSLPRDVEYMARLLVIWMYAELYPLGYQTNTGGWVTVVWSDITNYRLWEESISRTNSSSERKTSITAFRNANERKTFNQILQKYIKSDVLY